MRYRTSDGRVFKQRELATEWQSILDYNAMLKPQEIHCGRGVVKLQPNSLTEILTLRKYLAYYLDFDIEEVEKVPMRDAEGVEITIDRNKKEVKVVWV